MIYCKIFCLYKYQLYIELRLQFTVNRSPDLLKSFKVYNLEQLREMEKSINKMFLFLIAATPSGMVAKAKWNAWNERKGISQDDAKKQYIELAQQWSSKYA